MFTEWEKVDSSMLAYWQYNDIDEKLRVMFRNKSVYEYDNVKEEAWTELTRSIESKGKLFNRLIKGNKEIAYKKVDTDKEKIDDINSTEV